MAERFIDFLPALTAEEAALRVPAATTEATDRVFHYNYCPRRFYSSQALGSHQNANKRERAAGNRRWAGGAGAAIPPPIYAAPPPGWVEANYPGYHYFYAPPAAGPAVAGAPVDEARTSGSRIVDVNVDGVDLDLRL